MESDLDSRFNGVETALNTLIESITTYNPSPQAASDLVAADDSLSQGLEQLAQHQSNHAHIVQLRHTVSTLEAQIKSTLALLVTTRKELLDAPAGSPPDDDDNSAEATREVAFDELLAYAKRIARFTVPPSFRAALDIPKVGSGAREGDAQTVNGNLTAAAATATATEELPLSSEESGHVGGDAPEEEGLGWSSLTEEQKANLEFYSRLPFVPWPNEEDLRQKSALAFIQRLVDRGTDPSTILSPKEQEEADQKAQEEAEEQERLEKEAEERRRQRAMAGYARQEHTAAPTFGGLDLYDPDEAE